MGGICYLMDNSTILSTEMQPGIGLEGCLLKSKFCLNIEGHTESHTQIICLIIENRMTEFLYLYMPIMIIMVSNFMFFVLTALKIRRVQVEMAKITAKEDSRRHQTQLDKEKDK